MALHFCITNALLNASRMVLDLMELAMQSARSMSENFTIRSYIVAEVEVGYNDIYGSGRAEFPVLMVNLKFVFRSLGDSATGLDFREIRCRLSPFDGTYVALSLPTRLKVCVNSGEERKDDSILLQIPLDHTQLALINRLRKGGDVKLRLDL